MLKRKSVIFLPFHFYRHFFRNVVSMDPKVYKINKLFSKPLQGKATKEGTLSFLKSGNLGNETYFNQNTSWTLSKIGFGSYRISSVEAEHHASLTMALSSKRCNLIDTSTNYTDGKSEELIGRVLNELCESNQLRRENVIVVSKAGYIQYSNLLLASERKQKGSPFQDVVEVSPSLWYCISPDFLEHQLNLSLQRLRLETLDVFLLHNPEYYFQKSQDAVNSVEFYRCIRNAFEFLEKKVDEGKIQFYGVSSNHFVLPSTRRDHLSLEHLLNLAHEVRGAEHHFAVVQYPCNILESAAVTERNNNNLSISQFAEQHRLLRLSNRPFNCIEPGTDQLIRMVDYPTYDQKKLVRELKEAFDIAIHLEEKYPGKKDNSLPDPLKFSWAKMCAMEYEKLVSNVSRISFVFEEAYQELEKISVPRLFQWVKLYVSVLKTLEEALQHAAESRMKNFFESLPIPSYPEITSTTIPIISNAQSSSTSSINSTINDYMITESKQQRKLTHNILRILLSANVADCILVGMRQQNYVTDILIRFIDSNPEKIPYLEAMKFLESFPETFSRYKKNESRHAV